MKKCPKCSKEGIRLIISPYYGSDPFPNSVIKMVCPSCGFTTTNLWKYADEPDKSKGTVNENSDLR